MDFFATDQPILNKEAEAPSSDADAGMNWTILLCYYKPTDY